MLIATSMMCAIPNDVAFAHAVEEVTTPSHIVKQDDSVTFQNLDQLTDGESLVAIIADTQGDEAQIGITPVFDMKSVWSNSQSYRVWYVSGFINAEFYMTVTNNRVSTVYDRYIMTIGGTYSQAQLTRNTACTYGQLDFVFTALGNIAKSDCWLRGTVTGANNEITVSYRM